MSSVFPLDPEINDTYQGYYWDGEFWKKQGIEITENYLEESSASATYLTKVSASNTYLTQTSASTTYINKNIGGLNLVVPTSVTGGTLSTNGQITFSGATSVDINGCFSSTYDNYRVLIYAHAAAGGPALAMNFRDNAGIVNTGYYGGVWSARFDGVTAATAINDASAITAATTMGNIPGNRCVVSLDIYRTSIDGVVTGTAFGGSNSAALTVSANKTGMTNFSGLTISPTSSTMTGTIRIYGYNNGS